MSRVFSFVRGSHSARASRGTLGWRHIRQGLAGLSLALAAGTVLAGGEAAGSSMPAAAPALTVAAPVPAPLANEFSIEAADLSANPAYLDWFGQSPFRVSSAVQADDHCVDVSRVANAHPSLSLIDKVRSAASEQEGLVTYVSQTFRLSADMASRIVKTAYREALFAGVSPLLVLAIIEKESGFQPSARSPVGAIGLMQVMAKYHVDRFSTPGKRIDLTHVETNIKVGSRILREYLDAAQGNIKQALSRYSGGTKGYSTAVLDTYQRLKSDNDPNAVKATR